MEHDPPQVGSASEGAGHVSSVIPPSTDVSVIICAYAAARWSYLVKAISSVQAQSRPPREIIVVIDHNEDLLRRVRDELGSVVSIPNVGFPGAAGARNSGAQVAQGSVLAFLDDDAVATPHWIEAMWSWFDDPGILGVGGDIEPVWEQRRPAWFPPEFDWVVGCTYRGVPVTISPVRRLISANMSIRLATFIELGGFRKGFGKVGARSQPEDTELCIRAIQRWPGTTWLYAPSVRVYHHVPPPRARFTYFLVRCYNEGRGKAEMVALVGPKDGLNAERTYVRVTLPRGVVREVTDAIMSRDINGLWRAGAIVIGVATTGLGYVLGRTGAHRLLARLRSGLNHTRRQVRTAKAPP